jgi:hypothetical protein
MLFLQNLTKKLMRVFMKKNMYLFFIVINLFVQTSIYSADIVGHNDNKRVDKTCYIAICCVFQHEAPWLKEWLEFHLMIGVEHFYLYNNLSNDDYLSILQPYIASGIVELFEYPEVGFNAKNQSRTYNHALALAKEDGVKWLAIIDADEFITPNSPTALRKILKKHERYPGIYLRWQIFGTSEVDHLEEGELMIEKLMYRAPKRHPANKWGKSIVQPELTRHSLSPHVCSYLNHEKEVELSIKKLRINHYYFRTEAYLHQIKIPRLKRTAECGTGNIFSYVDILHFRPIANSIYDNSMKQFIKPLKDKMSR